MSYTLLVQFSLQKAHDSIRKAIASISGISPLRIAHLHVSALSVFYVLTAPYSADVLCRYRVSHMDWDRFYRATLASFLVPGILPPSFLWWKMHTYILKFRIRKKKIPLNFLEFFFIPNTYQNVPIFPP